MREFKTFLQLLCIEYIFAAFSLKTKEFYLHIIKHDRLLYHFAIKKAKWMHISRDKHSIWDSFTDHIKVDHNIFSSLKNLFFGNNLYVFLSPFDHLVTLPILNPSSIVKTDKTYNFIKIEIPCDIVDKKTGSMDTSGVPLCVLPQKLKDLRLKFIWGKIRN